jgi:hypothetical protein
VDVSSIPVQPQYSWEKRLQRRLPLRARMRYNLCSADVPFLNMNVNFLLPFVVFIAQNWRMAMNVKLGKANESYGIFVGIILLEGLTECVESLSNCSKLSILQSNPELATKSKNYLTSVSRIVIIKSAEVSLWMARWKSRDCIADCTIWKQIAWKISIHSCLTDN